MALGNELLTMANECVIEDPTEVELIRNVRDEIEFVRDDKDVQDDFASEV
jgi:hypothetical protein